MDSRLLAGAYSKQYKYIEREHIEALKNVNDTEKTDVLAKTRWLSQETNRRRKLLAQKRKNELAQEEKRRQEILNRRHEEQQQATEKYQRYNIPSRPPNHPRHSARRHGLSRTHTGLDEALHLVRGSSSSAIQRMYQLQQTNRDPMERPYIKSSTSGHAGNAGHGDGNQSHTCPQSGTQRVDSAGHAELMERSLQNLASSRSRFEQQLEHHQQMLVEQHQKSLYEFNEAIRHEIDTDTKVQGTEEDAKDSVSNHTDSLSSLDSLEEGNNSPLSGSLPENQAQQEFAMAVKQTENCVFDKTGIKHVLQQQVEQPSRDAAAYGQQNGAQAAQIIRGPGVHSTAPKGGYGEPVTNVRGTSHIIGPIPQGYNSSKPDTQQSSTPVVEGSYYMDSLETQHASGERRVTVGMALRLPQQPSVSQVQPIKQPAPALQYNSQLLAHRKFETGPAHGGDSSVPTSSAGTVGLADVGQHDISGGRSKNNNLDMNPGTNTAAGEYSLLERPKAHVYAWTSPSPVEEPAQNASPVTGNNDSHSGDSAPAFSANMAADRVMATKVNPQSSRSTAAAATTTWVYQTVSSAHTQNREAVYAQAAGHVNGTHQANTNVSNTQQASHNLKGTQEVVSFGTASQSSQARNTGQAEIPRGQGQKPGTVTTTVTGHTQASTRVGTGTLPHHTADMPSCQNYRGAAKEPKLSSQNKEASIAKGTLCLLNGHLSMLDNTEPEPSVEKRVVFVENPTDVSKEVRGILKRAPREGEAITRVKGTASKFNVQDSLEIAKKHWQIKHKMLRKKAVRFADLHYKEEEVEEDTDSADSMTELTVAKSNAQENKKPHQEVPVSQPATQRARPASARVTSVASKPADARSKAPHVVSAGPMHHTPAARPKAAAHIIMSGENQNFNGYIHNNHTSEATTARITVHKSELEKKVMLVNNNFMSRVPVYSGASTTIATTSSSMAASTTAIVYTASQGRPGASAQASMAPTTYTNTANCNGFSKTMPAGGDRSRLANGKSMMAPTVHNTTILPSHSHFNSTNNNSHKAVYNENGLRIDRTPTDDEINNLWMNMRSILEMGGEKGAPSALNAGTSSTTNNTVDHQSAPRQTVQLSHKYIDGTSLGIPNGMNRVMSGSAFTRPSAAPANGSQAGHQKAASPQKNGYLQRYSLLHQRRNPSAGISSTARNTGFVEQTLHPMPLPSNGYDPHHAVVSSAGYEPRQDVSESMAGFLAAEQMVQTHGTGVSDSHVMAAMDSAQQQQEVYNSIRQKYAKGGPAALSMEEHRLLESLDRLNDRLRAVENRVPSNQTSTYGTVPANHQVYVHSGGFRGHQVISSQRRNSAGIRPTLRPGSSRLLNRQHY